MNLASDYTHPTPAGGQCRIRLYIPEKPEDAPVVICTETAEGNGGMSITNCASERLSEVLAAKVIEANQMERPPSWLEHYEDGARSTEEDPHTFDLVTFASYEPFDFVSSGGWQKRTGRPSWKALDRATVEALIGREV